MVNDFSVGKMMFVDLVPVNYFGLTNWLRGEKA